MDFGLEAATWAECMSSVTARGRKAERVMERLKPSVSAGAALARKQQQRLNLLALQVQAGQDGGDWQPPRSGNLKPNATSRATSAGVGISTQDARQAQTRDANSSSSSSSSSSRANDGSVVKPRPPHAATNWQNVQAGSPRASRTSPREAFSETTKKHRPTSTSRKSLTPQSAKRKAKKRESASPRASPRSRASPERPARKREVVIHVRDKAHKLSRDFFCDKDVLVREMPYFRPYLKDLHKMDISVHCDVKIFEWLMRRIRSPDDARLDIRSATSVLIASEFLGMSTLVQEATAFVAQHLCEIMALPIDLTCLGDATVRRLARLISLNTLIGLSDPRNVILGTLYRLRAEELLQSHGPALASCKHCSALYSRRFADRLICPRAPASVDFNGRLCQRHEPIADDWDVVRSFIAPMRHRNAQEWKRIFWTLWGATKLFQCIMCETYFDAASTGGCRVHASSSEKSQICCSDALSAAPEYFACGPTARHGCVPAPHRPRSTEFAEPGDVALLVIYSNSCCDPILYSAKSTLPGNARSLKNNTIDTDSNDDDDDDDDDGDDHNDDDAIDNEVRKAKVGSSKLNAASFWARGALADAPTESLWPIKRATRTINASSAYLLERQRDEDSVNMRALTQRLRTLRA